LNVEIVMDGARIVAVSGRRQGGELIRIDEARKLAHDDPSFWPANMPDTAKYSPEAAVAWFYDRMRVETHRVRDEE